MQALLALRFGVIASSLVMSVALAHPRVVIADKASRSAARSTPRLRALVVVFDGLRPDFITPERMPRLTAFGAAGIVSLAHHSIFPTVTRVNASALITGMTPAGHGILDNEIYLPRVDSVKSLNTGEAADMQRADSVLHGALLTTPTLPDLLRARGKSVVVASAGSSGSAYLLAGAGRAITINADLSIPHSLASMVNAVLGPAPKDASPNLGRNARAVDALLRIGVDSLNADLAFLWLSDPDHTAHAAGLGSAIADSSIRAADREFGRALDGIRARGLDTLVDIFVVSDHGFSTHAGSDAPIKRVLASLRDRIVVAGGAVYVRRGGDSTRRAVVRALQAAPSVGAIFTRGVTGDLGALPGTLAYSSIGWDHPRSGDVLFSANWSHTVNTAGIAGSTDQAGVAGHGTTSPHDINATLVAAGPHLRRGVRSVVPSSNADIAPTLLQLLGATPSPSMSGRVLVELLRSDKRSDTVRVARDSVSASTSDGYRTTLYRSRVGQTIYVDSTKTMRRTK